MWGHPPFPDLHMEFGGPFASGLNLERSSPFAAGWVNGKDLSKATHEEAVEAFRNAKEPIVVQVLRRAPLIKMHGNSQDIQLMDASTQTDITFEHIMALAKLRPTTPPVPDICPFLLSDSFHSLHPVEHEFYEGNDYLSSLPTDADKTEDFECECWIA
uniref:PDZ domain-containing RING finger protein 4 n=1 Tax=Sphaerodactylus townsendi TaxID=933632 RepID=A0ACB8FP24_9SAUR